MHPLLDPVDWAREGADAVELLRALLRFDTTNPPGGEADCIAFLADYLRAAGLDPEVLDSSPGRANLVVRLRGGGDGTVGPLLLHGHVDVVEAEADRWRHPPFGAEVHDGQVWGRGAVDMKNMVAMSAAVLALLLWANLTLACWHLRQHLPRATPTRQNRHRRPTRARRALPTWLPPSPCAAQHSPDV